MQKRGKIMARNYSEAPQPARQVVWKYWGFKENALDKDFYVALQSPVANTIRDHFRTIASRLWVGREVQFDVGSYKLRARLTMIDPVTANTSDSSTNFIAHYYERPKDEHQDVSAFIAEVLRYPDPRQKVVYESLVGIDEIKTDMQGKLEVLLRPQLIDRWAQTYYGEKPPGQLIQVLRDRYPLIVLEGEVGAGKTALARSIGHILAECLGTSLALFVVNAQVRGGGHVGELTQNISRAFDEAERCQEEEQIPVMILIDEADSLAQVRGTQQTHHEDDAGVNTLIQRIDRLRGRPMAVVFSTNLFQQLDAAILRRATAAFHFDRPDFAQRVELFRYLLQSLGMNESHFGKLAQLTNPCPRSEDWARYHRYTYSDISQRIIPRAVEKAIGEGRTITHRDIEVACKGVLPTPDSFPMIVQFLDDYARYFEPGHDFSAHLSEDQ
jgi:SpoVK/Ycf46/Vps4 family AAA+-type ATPase